MILEALSWASGTSGTPVRHVVASLPGGLDVYFLKPGKEAFERRTPNPHDMTPVVGDVQYRPAFNDVWTALSSVSLLDFEAFRQILVLIYRSAYLLDHEPEGESYRYRPKRAVLACVEELQSRTGRLLPFGLLGFLHYLDVIGWNEDVKYHVEGGKPTFTGARGFPTGRINTLLTCVRVTYQVSDFARRLVAGKGPWTTVDFRPVYGAMQAFSNGRGTCRPTHEQLLEWLGPYVVREG